MIDKTPDFRNWNWHFSEKLPDVFEFICTDPTMFFEFHQFAGVSVYWILATWFRLVYFFRKQIQRIYQNLILCIPMYVLNIAINLGYGYYQFGPHWVFFELHTGYYRFEVDVSDRKKYKSPCKILNTCIGSILMCIAPLPFKISVGVENIRRTMSRKVQQKLSPNHIEMEKLIQFLRETWIFISLNLKCWWHQYLDKVWNFVHWCTYWGRKTWKITMSIRKIEKYSMIPQPRKMKADPCLSFFTGLTICTNDQFDNRYEFNTPMTNRLSRCLFRNFELHPCLIQQIISNRQQI